MWFSNKERNKQEKWKWQMTKNDQKSIENRMELAVVCVSVFVCVANESTAALLWKIAAFRFGVRKTSELRIGLAKSLLCRSATQARIIERTYSWSGFKLCFAFEWMHERGVYPHKNDLTLKSLLTCFCFVRDWIAENWFYNVNGIDSMCSLDWASIFCLSSFWHHNCNWEIHYEFDWLFGSCCDMTWTWSKLKRLKHLAEWRESALLFKTNWLTWIN